MTDRIAAVTGASGFVGRAVVRELLNKGWTVRALIRDRDKARRTLPRHDCLSLVAGDVLEESTLRPLVQGAQACVNAVGIIRESGRQTFQRMHVETVRNLAAACREAGVKRFVHISALGVHDEGPAPYQKTKFEGEQVLRRSGLDWTILRPGLIHGPGSELMQQMKGWVTGEKQPWFFLPYFSRGIPSSNAIGAGLRREPASVQPVAVEDVAAAVGSSLEKNESIGEIYNLVGPERYTWPELLKLVRDNVPDANADLDPLGIPAEIAAVQAKVAKAIGIGGLLPFDEGMARMGAIDSVATLEKAREHLGFVPKGFAAGLKGYAGRL